MLVGEITGSKLGVAGVIVSKTISVVTALLSFPEASREVIDILLFPSNKSKVYDQTISEFIDINFVPLIQIEVLDSLVPERVWGETFVGESTTSKVGWAGGAMSFIV